MNESTDKVPPENEEKIFLEFYYREIRDLCKHFLTLISATFVASITFADTIVPLSTATISQRWMLTAVWVFLLAALVSAGVGLYLLFVAAEKAVGELIFSYRSDFKTLAKYAAGFLDLSAVAYGVALILLAVTGIERVFG